MTPLEARRLLFKDNELDKSAIPVKFARAVSRENMQNKTTIKLKVNPHINDSMRRVSSFYKKRYDSISNLINK